MAEPKDEFVRLVERAIGVLQRHKPSDGLTDHQAMVQMYAIFDTPNCREILDIVTPIRKPR